MTRTWFLIIAMTVPLGIGFGWDHTELDRGIELFQAGKYEEAEGALSAAVQADPENARAHEFLGRTRLALKKVGEAQSELAKADQLSPDNATVKISLARIYLEQRDLDKAESAANKAAQLGDANPDIPLYRGAIAVAKRDYKTGVRLLEEALEKNPEAAYAHYYAGLAYNGLRQPDKMVEHFRAFLKLAPDAPEAAKVESLLRATR